MQAQVEIKFDQLVKIVKTLPIGKLRQLKAEIDKKTTIKKGEIDLKKLLLNGPVATKNQMATIENNRKIINQWRAI